VPQIEKYMNKISGPLVDRIDLHIEVPAVPFKDLAEGPAGSSSSAMREQVVASRRRQQQRFAGTRTRQNGQMSHRQIRDFCKLDTACMNMLKASMTELGLSARAHDKILRVARTIADLDESEAIKTHHLSEAINYRMLDRQLWT
jgi:magnesium chelatase family protein